MMIFEDTQNAGHIKTKMRCWFLHIIRH